MGYMRHNVIIVSGIYNPHPELKSKEKLFRALEMVHRKAKKLFTFKELRRRQGRSICLVSPISEPTVNGYASFAVFPDGSKEGWDTSNQCDEARDKFVEWLRKNFKWELDWVEVQFGDNDKVTKVVRDSDEKRRSRGR